MTHVGLGQGQGLLENPVRRDTCQESNQRARQEPGGKQLKVQLKIRNQEIRRI